jgi:hypothetical protein
MALHQYQAKPAAREDGHMDLSDRVEALERTNRWLTYALVAVGFLAVAGALRSFIPRPPGDLRVQRLALVDGQGRECAILRSVEGEAQLLLYDQGVLPRVALSASSGPVRAAGLALYDRVGARATLTADADGGAALALEGDGKSSGGAIALEPAGDVTIRAWGEGGAVTIDAPADQAGSIEVRDSNGTPIGRLPASDPTIGGR